MAKASLITGATSGIGKGIALELAARGDLVGVLGRRADRAEEVVQAIEAAGGKAMAVVADASEPESVADAVERFVAWAGRLDCVVANAGIAIRGTVIDLDIADWRRLMAINLDGVFYTAKYAMPHLIASRGSFTAIASHGGVMGVSHFASYSASKFGVVGFVRSIALDHAAQGVRANVVCPGSVYTEMSEKNLAHLSKVEQAELFSTRTPQGRIGTVTEIAKAVAYLSSDDAGYTNGAVLVIDGGAAAGFTMHR
jgi:meso-butanediol dehydrogenase/(S,S)-butanediol dehydrogenase/diacetyl reductase